MRRIAIALILAAAAAGIYSCAADAPTAPKPGSGGGTTSNALSVLLNTTNANPKAGTCTLIQATVSLNGVAVPDGSTVNFSTDFGTFGQNGLPLVSVITTGGVAPTALCGPGEGQANVKAQATVAGKSNSATLPIVFQPGSGTLPFISFCNPSFGPTAGGTPLTLNGGRFFGTTSTTRIQFTANGVTRDGLVTAVTSTAISVTTPGFPELNAPTTPAAITVTMGTNLASPVVLSLPNCFAYGASDASQPVIASLLPSSGTNDGNTRVTIIGSGFSTAGVQVFFGSTEATVVSVSYNQVVVLSPRATAQNPNQNSSVPVTVKNIGSGVVSLGVNFTYTPKVAITAISNGTQPLGGPYAPVTIFGQGFSAPVAVSLAGVPALPISVSATELVVMPGSPLTTGCGNVDGPVSVVNIDTGDSATSDTGLQFHYVNPLMAITSVAPAIGGGGTIVTIQGINLPASVSAAEVRFGNQTALVQSATSSQIVVVAPTNTAAAPPCTGSNVDGTLQTVATVDITVTNRVTGCNVVASGAFQMQLPCVLPTPGP